jgi:hypothetical protein
MTKRPSNDQQSEQQHGENSDDRKLLNHGFLVAKLKSSLRNACDRQQVNRYGMAVSQMTTDMFCLSYSQSGPVLIPGVSLGL